MARSFAGFVLWGFHAGLLFHAEHLGTALQHFLHILADELQHVRFLVIGLVTNPLVTEPVLASEALQRSEEHTSELQSHA